MYVPSVHLSACMYVYRCIHYSVTQLCVCTNNDMCIYACWHMILYIRTKDRMYNNYIIAKGIVKSPTSSQAFVIGSGHSPTLFVLPTMT